jgi:hypothetical protein
MYVATKCMFCFRERSKSRICFRLPLSSHRLQSQFPRYSGQQRFLANIKHHTPSLNNRSGLRTFKEIARGVQKREVRTYALHQHMSHAD